MKTVNKRKKKDLEYGKNEKSIKGCCRFLHCWLCNQTNKTRENNNGKSKKHMFKTVPQII